MNQDEIDLDSINYRGVIKDLLKNWWMIILAGASLWLAVTGVGELIYVPQYTVSSTLVVSAKGDSSTYTSLAMATQMADVMKEVFQSDVMKELVEKETGKTIDGVISCEQVQETNLLVLKVTTNDPQNSYLFMNSALKHYDEVSDYVFTNASLQILQEPTIPTSPSNSPILMNRRNELALLAAAVMAGIIVCLYLFRHTLKTSKNASKLLDGKILGVVPFEKKKGKTKKSNQALLINSPIVSMSFVESNRKIASRIENHLNRHQQKIILVTSISENEGKSTVTANIALSLVEKNKKVLIIDGDFRKPAQYKVFDKEKSQNNSLVDILTGKISLEDNVYFNKRTNIWELFVYQAVEEPAGLMDTIKLKEIVNKLKEQFDYIIIDCSPSTVSTDAEVWMDVADTTLSVVRQDWSDIRVINDTVDLIWQSNCDFTGFILNFFIEEKSDQEAYGYANYAYNRHESR